MGSAVPKLFGRGAKNLVCRAYILARVNGVLAALWPFSRLVIQFVSLPLFVGKIISPGSCVGDVSRLMSRNLFAVINTAPTWNS